MYQILNPSNTFDRSPFQWARSPYLEERLGENQKKLVDMRHASTGRLDSNHLLSNILSNLNVRFSGDLYKYMAECEVSANRLLSSIGMVGPSSHGGVYTKGLFYPGCPEIIIYVRDQKTTVMDLWGGWRLVAPIQVLTHPVCSTELFEPAVLNDARLSHPGLAIITIDIPLLAAQHQMWKAMNPGQNMEKFLTEIPLPNMMRSHMNVALFNMVQAQMGIKEDCRVENNLPFAQTPTDIPATAMVKEVIDKISSTSMTPNKVLSSIPAIWGLNYLQATAIGSVQPTFQITWALIAQKMEAFAVCMEFCKRFGYDKAMHEITVAKRTAIDAQSDKTFSNGLTTAASILLTERFNTLVVDRLP